MALTPDQTLSATRFLLNHVQAQSGRVSARPPVIGQGSNVLGSPRSAMTWLINELSSLGITARQGQIVTTGTCLVPMPIQAGDEVISDFGELGRVSVTLI